jgi:hypothetical protein
MNMTKIDIDSDLSPEYRHWFESQIQKGRFPTVKEGLDTIFGWFKHEIDDQLHQGEDVSWVAPFLKEADDDIAAGRTRPMQEVHAALVKRLAPGDL